MPLNLPLYLNLKKGIDMTQLTKIVHNTVADMITDSILQAGDIIETLEYSAGVGSEGGNTYRARAATSEPEDGGSLLKSVTSANLEFVGLFKHGVWAEQFGAEGTSDQGVATSSLVNATGPFRAALAFVGRSVTGGLVQYSPMKRYSVGLINEPVALTIPVNTELSCGKIANDQDESVQIPYDRYLGGALCVEGTIRMNHGSCFKGGALVSSGIKDYDVPCDLSDAFDLVASFSGTAITIVGTGCKIRDTLILGFDSAITTELEQFNGNRIDISHVRFDCTNGVIMGSGSDITRIQHCHAWPYLTADIPYLCDCKDGNSEVPTIEMKRKTAFRSGVAFKLQGNSDSDTIDHCYAYGYNIGFELEGGTYSKPGGEPFFESVNSAQLSFCRADSGRIGETGNSIGFKIGNYAAQVSLLECQSSRFDHLGVIYTSGATAVSERLNNVRVLGGVWQEPTTASFKIDNGYVAFQSCFFAKSRENPHASQSANSVFAWNTIDGGAIIGCCFEEMFQVSGEGLVFDPVSQAVANKVTRHSNMQKPDIHTDNRMSDNF